MSGLRSPSAATRRSPTARSRPTVTRMAPSSPTPSPGPHRSRRRAYRSPRDPMTPSRRGDAVAADATALTAETLRAWPLPLDDDDDKRDRGTVLVIAGTVRTPGAALLAGLAAMRAGAGRLQIATVEPSAAALGVAVPEALIVGLPPTDTGAPDPVAAIELAADRIAGADAILLGPGFDDLDATRALVAGVV